MRNAALVALMLPLVALAAPAVAAPAAGGKTIKIKEEIVNKCGNFPYAPTIMVDAKAATRDDMLRTRTAVNEFITEVSHYQKCIITLGKTLGDDLNEKDSEFLAKLFNRTQDERDVLALDFNKLVDDYHAANGIKADETKPAAKAADTGTSTKKPAATKPAAKPAAKPATSTTP